MGEREGDNPRLTGEPEIGTKLRTWGRKAKSQSLSPKVKGQLKDN